MDVWPVILGVMLALGVAVGVAIYFTVDPDPTAGAPGSRGASAPASAE